MASQTKLDADENDVFLDEDDFNKQVLQAINKYKQTSGELDVFSSPQNLEYHDLIQLFKILMEVRLGRYEIDAAVYLSSSNKRQLIRDFKSVYERGSFADMIKHPDMPSQFCDGPQGITPSTSSHSLQGAFAEKFLGKADQLLIRTLNRDRTSHISDASNRPYSFSIAVIQSSGTGKSRMVEQAGNTVFTIPINIRPKATFSDKSTYKKTFPPPDPIIRKYFEDRKNQNDEQQKVAYTFLLEALFDGARKLVKDRWPGTMDAPLAWADYLKEGQTERETGSNRNNYFAAAVSKAEKKERKAYKGSTLNKTLGTLEESLRQSCNKLVEVVYTGPNRNKNAVFVYFDEAHALTTYPENTTNRSPYHNLGTVISRLKSCLIYFIFLSTNSYLEGFAPPPSHYPLDRITEGSQLIPPFNELALNLHRKQALHAIDSLTLQNVCTTKFIVGFGRPLWYSTYKAYPPGEFFEFAMDELVASGIEDKKEDAAIAAIAVRTMITFSDTNPGALALQSRLTESHMRLVYSIPKERGYMHTGYSSEPVLAEVAGRYYKEAGRPGLPRAGPPILARACHQGFVARGERGELAGRFLMICAYEDALDLYPIYPTLAESPRHHRPVPLLYFLRALFRTHYHNRILDAIPITAMRGRVPKKLRQAFSNSYVFFSHFALARDSEMIAPFGLASALIRGMALQAKENQESIDAVIPIHLGSLTTPISPKTTSALNLQFKNRKQANQCHVDRTITVPNEKTPTISIVFEFGLKGKDKQSVIVQKQHVRGARSSRNVPYPGDRHYCITVHGYNSEVFGAIRPDNVQDYKTILGSATAMEDFPRNHIKENLDAFHDLNQDFSGVLQEQRNPNLFSTARDAPSQPAR